MKSIQEKKEDPDEDLKTKQRIRN
uniref:Uncharacterized protein n=1 Tax=Rhizophora mucronata TaxID=61149 RepID=A0A2P2QEM9_RHIMU